MKISKLRKLAWVFLVLALTTTSVFAQGWRNMNSPNLNQNNCLSLISGLNENQKNQILEMEELHQKNMDEIRMQQRSITDFEKKSEIRSEMTKMVADHRNAIKNLLDEDQQLQYERLHAKDSNGKGQNVANCKGNRNFQVRGQFAGKWQFNNGNEKGKLYSQNNAACNGNLTRFANNRKSKGRGSARFNQCGNLGRGNARFSQQNNANYLNN